MDLVEELTAEGASGVGPSEGRVRERAAAPLNVPMVQYCGFLSLGEAQLARDQLREEQIRWEILTRETPESLAGGAYEEEYWIRVEASRIKQVQALLGFAAADEDRKEGSFTCGDCGKDVAEEESFCPHCGTRFDDD